MANIYKTPSATDSGSMNYHILDYAMAEGIGRLRNSLVATSLVNNYSEFAKDQKTRFAASVRVPKLGSISVQDKTPGNAITYSAATSTASDITINRYKYWAFLVEDFGSAFNPSIITKYMNAAGVALAEAIEADVLATYASASSSVGTLGSGINDASILTVKRTSRNSLTHSFNWSQPVYWITGPYGEEDLLGLANFVQYDRSGSNDGIVNGRLAKRYGFDFYVSNLVPHVTGSPDKEYNLVFQSDAIGIVFMDMDMSDMPEGFTSGVTMIPMYEVDDSGNRIYSMRTTIGYNMQYGGVGVTVDTMYGVGVVLPEHLITVNV